MNLRFARRIALLLVMAGGGEALAVDSLQQRVDALAQQVHLRYRHHAPSLAERRTAVEQTLRLWNKAQADGQVSPQNQQRMAAWLDEALRSAMPGGSGVIPSAPDFEAALPVEAAPLAITPAPAQAPPAVLEPVASEPITHRPVQPNTKPHPVVLRETPAAAPLTQPASPRTQPATPLTQSETKAERQRSQFVGPRATRQVVAKPVVPATPAHPAPAPERSNEQKRSKWSKHPAAAPLDWRDPFADDPTVSENPLRSGARRQALRPSFVEGGAVQLDLSLLTAQVRGYNASLRALQAAVLTLNDGDLDALVAAADELDQLSERSEFLDLYREGLNAPQKQALPESPSLDLVRELVRRKVRALAEQSPPRRAEDRRALEQLNERLAAGPNEASSH